MKLGDFAIRKYSSQPGRYQNDELYIVLKDDGKTLRVLEFGARSKDFNREEFYLGYANTNLVIITDMNHLEFDVIATAKEKKEMKKILFENPETCRLAIKRIFIYKH